MELIGILCRVERSKKDAGWKSLSGLFYFELIPKHHQQEEIFGSKTEENRMVNISFGVFLLSRFS
jgi:hypothetical protein